MAPTPPNISWYAIKGVNVRSLGLPLTVVLVVPQIWYALEGIGACTAFTNSNLTGNPLVHSVKLAEARFLLAERGVEHLVEPCQDELSAAGVKTVYYGQALLDSLDDTTPLPAERTFNIAFTDVRGLIYTSGTTGLPKGVMLTAGRWINTARGTSELLRLTSKDKFYTCLPMYHGAGQGLCILPVIYAGASVRLGRKFSRQYRRYNPSQPVYR